MDMIWMATIALVPVTVAAVWLAQLAQDAAAQRLAVRAKAVARAKPQR